MGFDRIERQKKFIGYLLVGKPFRHQFQNFKFTFANLQSVKFIFVENKFRTDQNYFLPGQSHTYPHTKYSKHDSHNAYVKFNGKITDQEAILKILEKKN